MTVTIGTIVGLQMDLETARQHIVRIHEHLDRAGYHLDQARNLIWELKERCGWRVLGYSSWRKCVMTEFEQSSSSVYRQLSAALVELDISPNGGIGTVNERVLRPLTKRNFNAEARQGVWAIANEVVGEGGKVTGGVVETVIETIKEILASESTQDQDGIMHPLAERVHAQIVAAVREKKIAHKEHIRRMDSQRDYILGGVKADKVEQVSGGRMGNHWAKALIEVDSIQREKLFNAIKSGKPIYASLWTEE